MTNAVSRKTSVELKTKSELETMRAAGRLAGRALQEAVKAVRAGVSTKELDRIAGEFIRKNGGKPTFIGYRGYPASLCVSLNNEVVHGIPGPRRIKEGDVVSLDVAATLEGFVGDTAITVAVPPVTKEIEKLIRVAEQSLFAAVDCMKIGNRLGDVGAAVQRVAESNGFGVVRDFVGHGIGRRMHEEPAVANYGTPGTGLRLEPGLVLAVEPMVTMGDWHVKVLPDGWTVVTEDGSLAAHFEHTIAVTENGPEILTEVKDL